MGTTSDEQDWEPSQGELRHAEITASIHRVIAWFYGAVGLLVTVCVAIFSSVGSAAFFGLVIGAVVLLHAALAVGARKRSEAAKFGSVAVGVLMLFAFPIGTVVGGFLIYNGLQAWPPRRDATGALAGRGLRDA